MDEIDYQAVLTDLERRREELNSAINAIRLILGQGEVAPPAASNILGKPSSDAFFGMSIIDAAKKYLGMAKRPMPAPDIADALKGGGLLNASKNFTATVYTTLLREQIKNGSVIKMPDKSWGLAEWYPSGARARTSTALERASEALANVRDAADLTESDETSESEQLA